MDRLPESGWSKLIKRHNRAKSGTEYELPPVFFRAKAGHALLQKHGARVAFRSIRIRTLKPMPVPAKAIPPTIFTN